MVVKRILISIGFVAVLPFFVHAQTKPVKKVMHYGCPRYFQRQCVDCVNFYNQYRIYYHIPPAPQVGTEMCVKCYNLKDRKQQGDCQACVLDEAVIRKGNEQWCAIYASSFGGSAQFIGALRTQKRDMPH